ncbi:MAG: class I SAM-dependent methyltransferase [bacterium]|nr:class I SAM-dependent methyltransferase [bacterium]
MSFETLENTWNALGKSDPLWAILSHPEAEGGKWPRDRFFATGELEISWILDEIQHLGLPLHPGTVLDFGCGVGRATRALARRFENTHGVDLAPSMIDLARELDPGSGIYYHLHGRPDLNLFDDASFDFVYSRLVLQHMSPDLSLAYIPELVRVLRPGGLIAFQLPSRDGAGDAPLLAALLRPSARFAAEITTGVSALELRANERRAIRVRVTNAGLCSWQSETDSDGLVQIRLGNHWLDAHGAMSRFDDGRTPLPVTLGPGEATEVDLTVTAPAHGGDHLLELDLVQEDLSWFRDKGGATTRIPVRVHGDEPRLAPAWRRLAARISAGLGRGGRPAGGKTPFEMHNVSVGAVAGAVRGAGGELLAMQRDGTMRDGWPSYFYFLTRR